MGKTESHLQNCVNAAEAPLISSDIDKVIDKHVLVQGKFSRITLSVTRFNEKRVHTFAECPPRSMNRVCANLRMQVR